MLPSYMSSILRWGGQKNCHRPSKDDVGAHCCVTLGGEEAQEAQVLDKWMMGPPLTCLQAPTPPSWLRTSCRGLLKYLRSIRLHQAPQKQCWALSPGRGLQVMSCSSPASHLSSSFSLSVSSSISSSWTLALMAVSSWGHKCEVRLAQS